MDDVPRLSLSPVLFEKEQHINNIILLSLLIAYLGCRVMSSYLGLFLVDVVCLASNDDHGGGRGEATRNNDKFS